jgi:TolB-like protein/tRNA A-37 threonylcarbamoyl transferase component Bud32/Tfp pilus assembly protein PilF
MEVERWQRIEELYHSALPLPAEARREFLLDACSGDENLRREVESLLRHGDRTGSILESPVLAVLARDLAKEYVNEPLLQEGRTISHYRIQEAIGRGGMGVVYKAEDLKLRRLVALKLLPEALSRDPQALHRFEREAQAASALNHPNICTIYEIDESEGLHFIAIELLDGVTLKDRIARSPLPAAEAVPVAIQICRALEAAHAAGIIHRDIKPANIFLTCGGATKVVDFGVAKRVGLEPATEGRRSSAADMTTVYRALTVTGATVGTVAYMSPEQTRGETVDSRTDLFSLGAVVFEMITGRRPFSGESVAEIFSAIQNQPPLPAGKPVPQFGPALSKIVSKSLEKKREERYQSAEDLRLDLEQLTVRLEAAKRRVPRVIAAAFSFVLIVGIGVGVWKWPHAAGTGPIRSLAVLPLENLTGDPGQEYFADGMTDALITNLTKVGSLRVISRASAMHYKGMHKALPEIARELNVNAVLEGSVIRSGNHVRIRAQLVDAARDQNLWAQDYERYLQDVMRLQSEVAWDVVTQIQAKLTPEERQRIVAYAHCDPRAHDLFLQGMYHFFRGAPDAAPEEYDKSRDYFEQAVAADPACADAYVGRAYYYALASDDGLIPPAEGWPKVRSNDQKAAALDPNNAAAHIGLGATSFFYDWKFQEGIAQFRKALQLNPGWADGHREYSVALRVLGRSDESIAEARQAREADPFSVSMSSSLAWAYYYAHRWDEAIAQFKNTLGMDPQFLPAHEGLFKCFQQKNMEGDGVQQLVAEMEAAGTDDMAELIQNEYRSSGYQGMLRTLYVTKLKQFHQVADKTYISPMVFADLYSLLGEKDEAFKWMDKAYQERSSKLLDLKLDPDYDNLQSDPRFLALVSKIGLP